MRLSISIAATLLICWGVLGEPARATNCDDPIILDKDGQCDGNKGTSFRPVDSTGNPANFVITARVDIDASAPLDTDAAGDVGTVRFSRDGLGVQDGGGSGSKCISGTGGNKDEELIFTFDSPVSGSGIELGTDEYDPGDDEAVVFISLAGTGVFGLTIHHSEVAGAFTGTGGGTGVIDFGSFSSLPAGTQIDAFKIRETDDHWCVGFLCSENDCPAPTITCPNSPVMFDCEGPGGTVVEFEVIVSSECYDVGELTVTCEPFESGDLVPAGTQVTVTCTVTDPDGQTASCDFMLKVWDFTPPDINCPNDITVECDQPGGASVTFEVTATDICCPNEVEIVCEPPSGSFFPSGTTKVRCTATDWDNNSSECCFNVTVEDTTGPAISCPDDITVACTSPGGAIVEYEVTATDICGTVVSLDCTPPPGNTFPAGTTMVMCVATDDSGNEAMCSFEITVTDDPPTITCPGDITAECEGAGGAVVMFETTASDDCSDPVVDCIPPSGSLFPIGTTKVACTATDSGGQTATCCFIVTVEDTTDPTIDCPTDISVECQGPDGATVMFEVAASDLCGNVSVSCSHNSGDSFPCGTTTVDCTATDDAGNTATCSFAITVTDTVAPDIDCPDDFCIDGSDTPVIVDYTTTATDLCDPDPEISCDPPSGSIFNPGTTTVLCTATDNKGNSSICTFEVKVQMCVNFDEDTNGSLPDPTAITDQYEPIGILISGISDTGSPGVTARRTGAPGSTREDIFPTTPPNYVQTNSGGDDSDSGKITFTFFDPTTGSPTTCSFVQMTFLDIESSGQGPGGASRSRLKAFDTGGGLIDRVLIPFGANGNQFVATIGQPDGPRQIATVEAVIGNASDSGGVDEFCFLPNITPMTVRLLGPSDVYAGETLRLKLFVRNNTANELDVLYKLRGTPKLNKPGVTLDGPVPTTIPIGFDALDTPECIEIPIRGDRPRFWNRSGYIIVSYKDVQTNRFLGMGRFRFTLQPPRQ